MASGNIFKVILFNFISALIIAIVTVNILDAFGLKGGTYLGNLFGLYFLVVYGVNNLIEARKIPNGFARFLLAIVFIAVFDAVFLFIVPFLFGPNIFPPTESMVLNYSGAQFELLLSKEFYLVLFAIVVLIFNFLIYRRTKHLS